MFVMLLLGQAEVRLGHSEKSCDCEEASEGCLDDSFVCFRHRGMEELVRRTNLKSPFPSKVYETCRFMFWDGENCRVGVRVGLVEGLVGLKGSLVSRVG